MTKFNLILPKIKSIPHDGLHEVLIVWCLKPFSTVFKLHRGRQCTYPCFPGVLLNSTSHNLSKPLAAFPNNHCRNSGQR